MNGAHALDGLATVRAEALVEHYQRTREQLTRDWVDRNHRYSLLVALLAVAALLSFVQGPVVRALGALSTAELSSLLGKVSGSPDPWGILASLVIDGPRSPDRVGKLVREAIRNFEAALARVADQASAAGSRK